MSRLTVPSLTARTLRPTPTVSAPVAQRPALKNSAAQTALHTDQFEHGAVRSGASQAALAHFHPTSQQRLEFLQKFGAPKRENYPLTPAGTQQYKEAQTHYERELAQTTALVEYDKLKAQGGPKREDYPAGIAGAFDYKKARSEYTKKLQDLLVEAGVIRT
ncbi:MAG: hypothetical protein ACJ8AT_27180 [Hyalangium sp.]